MKMYVTKVFFSIFKQVQNPVVLDLIICILLNWLKYKQENIKYKLYHKLTTIKLLSWLCPE